MACIAILHRSAVLASENAEVSIDLPLLIGSRAYACFQQARTCSRRRCHLRTEVQFSLACIVSSCCVGTRPGICWKNRSGVCFQIIISCQGWCSSAVVCSQNSSGCKFFHDSRCWMVATAVSRCLRVLSLARKREHFLIRFPLTMPKKPPTFSGENDSSRFYTLIRDIVCTILGLCTLNFCRNHVTILVYELGQG